ncbi:hypothetical protein OSB04_002749 [Centaurea solstitialis]|uniref:Uncharacterized protein n=1 Tax=Centaurea solstitialis TaxID=347529 RepID=A0AA38UBQ2_9ASTR|nr:hypothetical protein OSB04_002749 [Centaurea solstitialis]
MGTYSANYANWVGLEARTKFSIVESDWRYIDKDEKAQFWAAIKQKWNLEDDNAKQATMSIASGSSRSFRSKLVNEYKNKNKTPFENALSKTNSEHAKMNDNPHHLGSRGYLGKQDSCAKNKDQGVLSDIHNMYSKRTPEFILARTVKSDPNEFILPDKMKPIAEDLVSYIEKDKQFSHGDWDPDVAVDPLAAVLGPEHPGHTRGVGHNVGLHVGVCRIKREIVPRKKHTRI